MEGASDIEDEVKRETASGDALVVRDFDVKLPDGRVLLADCNLTIKEGERLLITGASGCGKSTLLRTLAGIWPYGQGRIEIPEKSRILFLPQRPYLPLGSLRQISTIR